MGFIKCVFASFVHEKCGIRHIYLKHAADFLDNIDTTFKSEDEIIELICSELKSTFMSKKFLFEEDDPQGRGRRYIWKTDSKFGNSRNLVTIMVPESNNQYELITAFKRWAKKFDVFCGLFCFVCV
uniref:Uncharacterized protein n=1 Tax=Panagrolaimus superbus TaxID=310955 RepID=A0A914YA78_9BILA